jgi:hypothetical protein
MRFALLVVLALLPATASTAHLIAVPQAVIELPAVPHYELPSPPVSAIKPPIYARQDTGKGQGTDDRNDQKHWYESVGQWFTATYEHTARDPVALFTFVLAISTIGLWLVTWISGRRQSRETRRTIATMQETARRELRAYVSFAGFKALSGMYENRIIEWTISPVWENAGQTPTRNGRNHISWQVFSKDDGPEQIDFRDLGNATDYPTITIGPRSTVEGEAAKISVDTIWFARAIQGRIFIWGWMEYDDLFGPITPRRRTEFCSYLDWLGMPEEQAIAPRVYGKFNGADNDCYRKPGPRPDHRAQNRAHGASLLSRAVRGSVRF